MLETTLKFQKAFERLEEVDPHYLIELEDDVPRDIDWKNAKIFCKFLRTFYEVTKRLSGYHYVTSNYYFHDVMLIQSTIGSWSCSLDECLKSMAIRMDAKFKRYWGDLNKMNMMLFFAVVLDPCYKLKYVVHCYKKLYDKEPTKKLEAKIKEALGRLYTYYASLDPSSQRSEVGDTSVNNYMEDNQGESMVDDEYVISFESDFMNEEEDMRISKTELKIYLDEVCIKKVVGTPFDVLEWWKVNSSQFPVLSLMARDVLAIPVTTVASESAFSTSGRILDQFRSSLSPKVVESLICGQDWLRASPLPIELEARMDELADLESCILQDPDLTSAFTSPLA